MRVRLKQIISIAMSMAAMLLGWTGVADAAVDASVYVKKVCIVWDVIPSAVSYKLLITRGQGDDESSVVTRKEGIPINGYELDTSVLSGVRDFYWRVCPVDLNGREMGAYTEPKLLVDQSRINTRAPQLASEYSKMDYFPVYPVFSWFPMKGAHSYDLQISKAEPAWSEEYQVIRSFNVDTFLFYEYAGYTSAGNYKWQVRARDEYGKVMGGWSEPEYFQVTKPVKVAALGDSITHGGGACNLPPSYTTYCWESYSSVPIKNIGYSGDTVQTMLERFDRDVLAFQPRILVIMGGVNNYREGSSSWATIEAMEAIKNKCMENGIIPVFLTGTPINTNLMANVSTIEAPAYSWKQEQDRLNSWIMEQPFHIDIAAPMTDEYGQLKAELTTDGLHPDMEGKRIIGEAVSRYLLENFPEQHLLDKQ